MLGGSPPRPAPHLPVQRALHAALSGLSLWTPPTCSAPTWEEGFLLVAWNSLPWAISLASVLSLTSVDSVNPFSSGTNLLKSLLPKNTPSLAYPSA